MVRNTLKGIVVAGLALVASLPAWAGDFAALKDGDRFVVPVGVLMCRNQPALDRYLEASEDQRQWLAGACYVNAQPAHFNQIRELRNGTLVAKGLRGNPRIDRVIERSSYDAQVEQKLAAN